MEAEGGERGSSACLVGLEEESLLGLRGLLSCCRLLLLLLSLWFGRSTRAQPAKAKLAERIRLRLRCCLLLCLLLSLLLLLLVVVLHVQGIAAAAACRRLLSCTGLPVAASSVPTVPCCRLLAIATIAGLLLTIPSHTHSTAHLSRVRVVLLASRALLLSVHACRLLLGLSVARHASGCLLTVRTVALLMLLLLLLLLLGSVHVGLRHCSPIHASHATHTLHAAHTHHPLHAAHASHACHACHPSHASHAGRHHGVGHGVLRAEHVHDILGGCCGWDLLGLRGGLVGEGVLRGLAAEEVVGACRGGGGGSGSSSSGRRAAEVGLEGRPEVSVGCSGGRDSSGGMAVGRRPTDTNLFERSGQSLVSPVGLTNTASKQAQR